MDDQIRALAEYFVLSIASEKSRSSSEDMIKKACREIPTLLDEGWTLDTLSSTIYELATRFPVLAQNAYHIRELLGKTKPPLNLIEPDVFYYHNELRVQYETPRKQIVDGKLVYVEEEPLFRLEIKTYYGAEEFLDYFYKRVKLPRSPQFEKRDLGRLKHLIEQHDIDTLLFAIDVMVETRLANGLRISDNLFNIQDYMMEAEDVISRKRNQHRLMGINREVY